MKLIYVTNRPSVRSSHQYSIWLNHDDAPINRIIYAIDGDVNFKLLFKLEKLTGDIYIQNKTEGWWCHLEHDKLYKEFVDKKK